MHVRCSTCGFDMEYARIAPHFCSNCGTSFSRTSQATEIYHGPYGSEEPEQIEQTPVPLPPPETVGGYRLLRALGSGGMGTVYEGEQDTTGRRVAVKLIRPEYANSQDTVERFRREGRLASTITHPRCVFVLAADEEAGRPYIIMELMPGRTLADVVHQEGPLSVSAAVTRILDVIEGLQEAHRCGLIHRDVKPSNCFLDAEGRIKVGDFGLSKSLLHDGQLTQSGSFLGTLLYAAPEQIRNESVDQRADVYSVAATLYFLLTGRAPFQTDDDPAATLARTMTDPLTPPRTLRPDLPTTLDEVVLKGLARPRDKRWANLEELRLALLPFVPGPHATPGLGVRLAAYLLDAALLKPLGLTVLSLVTQAPAWLAAFTARQLPDAVSLVGMLKHWAALLADLSPPGELLLVLSTNLICGLVYFALPESIWGCSPGKYLCRLRVRSSRTGDRPGFVRAAGRFLAFDLILNGSTMLTALGLTWGLEPMSWQGSGNLGLLGSLGMVLLPPLTVLLGLVLLTLPMRQRNGRRGLHELLSGTRTIRLASARSRRLLRGKEVQPPTGPEPPEMPSRVGGYVVRGALRWGDGDRLLLGEDSVLGRSVWVWLRKRRTVPLAPARRELGRTTRPRWLAGGSLNGLEWDAFVASPGCPLPDLVGPRQLFGADVLPLLEQLTEELAAACADGTLPETLGVDQVWVQTSGRVQLLDMPTGPSRQPVRPGEARALEFLADVVRFMLEGRLPGPADKAGPVRAPLPRFAAHLLGRLTGAGQPFASLAAFRVALEETRERPVEVSRTRRGFHLVILAALLAPGLCWMLGCIPLLLTEFFWEHQTVVSHSRALASHLVGTPQARQLYERAGAAERARNGATLSTSWFLRRFPERIGDHIRRETWERTSRKYAARPPTAEDIEEEFAAGGEALGNTKVNGVIARENLPLLCGLILFWPLLWVLWAGLTRGGASLRFAGIQLVQADGRRAARWRCAWRALLVWLPVVSLLCVSGGLEVWRLNHCPEADLPAWLAWATWWLAAGLLPLYFWLGQRSPNRGLHDRLAGTFLVPR